MKVSKKTGSQIQKYNSNSNILRRLRGFVAFRIDAAPIIKSDAQKTQFSSGFPPKVNGYSLKKLFCQDRISKDPKASR